MEGVRYHPKAKCEECPLYERHAYVPTRMPANPRVAAVGEAPGFHETAYKDAFVGPSGKVLRRVMTMTGFKKDEVLYTNVVACRPEDNATPDKKAIDACRERLLGELADSGVRDVLALGGTAIGQLVGIEGSVTKLRVGPPKPPARSLSDTRIERVVPTWHPAYCLRKSDAFPTMVTDIEKLVRPPMPPWAEPDWKYYDEAELALQAIEGLITWQHLNERYELVVDIEVGIDKEVSFDHPNRYEMLCVGLGFDKSRVAIIGYDAFRSPSVQQALHRLLKQSKLIGHNLKFDLQGLYPHFKGLQAWFDTMLAHYVLDERAGLHGLKVLAVELLGAPKYDEEIRQFIPSGGNYANIPREILYKYCAMDVGATWDLFELFKADLDVPVTNWPYDTPVRSLRDVHDFMVAAANQLMYLELNGITIDKEYNTKLTHEFLEYLGSIEDEINNVVSETVGEPTKLNPRSPKQVREFLASQRILVDATDRDTLERIVGRLEASTAGARFLQTLLKHRKQQKLYSTYVAGFRKRMYRGRVYTTYLLHNTTSGRLASRNPNLQNVVRDKRIKRQFVASGPDKVLIQADYKQAEGRVIATLAQDDNLRDAFMSGDDIFDALCNQIHGEGNWGKEERVRIKAFFYGLSYGREAASYAKEYGWSLKETTATLDEFLGRFPRIRPWQNEVKKTVLDGGTLISPFGRHRRFSLITNQNRHEVLNEALSYLPQSTASDICLGALTELRPVLRGAGFIRLTIHDALAVECNRSDADQVSHLLTTTMVDHGRRFTDYVPFAVDVSMGASWADL